MELIYGMYAQRQVSAVSNIPFTDTLWKCHVHLLLAISKWVDTRASAINELYKETSKLANRSSFYIRVHEHAM